MVLLHTENMNSGAGFHFEGRFNYIRLWSNVAMLNFSFAHLSVNSSTKNITFHSGISVIKTPG